MIGGGSCQLRRQKLLLLIEYEKCYVPLMPGFNVSFKANIPERSEPLLLLTQNHFDKDQWS